MTPIDVLCQIVAPELNFLLTQPPFQMESGFDFGWFCREHAFCSVVIGQLLNLQCQIVRGDVAVYIAGKERLSTIGTTADHAWCATEKVAPLDLSPSFRHHWVNPQLNGPVCGLKQNGGFVIREFTATEFPDSHLGSDTFLAYIPREVLSHSAQDLIVNPLLILEHDDAALIALAVAYHAFLVATNQTRSLIPTRRPETALRVILGCHQDSKRQLLRLMA